VLQILGRSEDAARAFDRALGAAPDLWEAWQGRGAAAEAKGDWAGAAQCYRQALRLNPQATVARDRLGAIERARQPRP